MGRNRRKKDAPVHGVLVVNKPQGPTSHDVVQWVRRVLGTSQVGHTGTLDPMATGVLVLGVGQGTRLVQHLAAETKRYRTTLRLGSTTDTLDAEGQVVARAEIPDGLSLERVREVAAGFVGTHGQRAPKVSAIKVGGRALHERVRAGEEVIAPVRDVECFSIEVHRLTPVTDASGAAALDLDISLHTGKGYYVRSFGRDLAEALGTVGHLVALERVQNGAFGLERALDGALLAGDHDDACKAATQGALLGLREATRSLGHVTLNEAAVAHIRQGRAIGLDDIPALESLDALPSSPVFVLLDADGEVVALAERREDKVHVVRGFPARAAPVTEEAS